LGDLAKIKTLDSEGKLAGAFPAENVQETLESRLKRIINQKKVMLFMKGSPKQAACGFSQRIVNLLSNYDGIDYGHFDIFKDEEVREGLKKYSNWPTYPQLYVDGELVGGIDIC
jgi:Grx4 family monothiol glutaredoxin